ACLSHQRVTQKRLFRATKMKPVRTMGKQAGKTATAFGEGFPFGQPYEARALRGIRHLQMVLLEVMEIAAPEACPRIEHPLQRFPSNRLSEKFLHAIAAMSKIESFILLLNSRQDLLARKSAVIMAFETHYDIYSVSGISPGN